MARRIKRRAIKVAGQESATERQTRTAVRVISGNPYYQEILQAIRSGAPNTKIAEWMVINGMIDATQKTVVGYLQYFRKAEPRLCKPLAPSYIGDDNPLEDKYNGLMNGRSIVLDEETELLKLIKFQQMRLGIGFQSEHQINMLMQSNRREVEELRNLIMDLAKLRGLVSGQGSVSVNLNHYSPAVNDDLKGIQQDEGQRNTMASLVADLVGVTNG